MTSKKILRVREDACGLLVVDIQEKFAPVIHNWDMVVARSARLIRFFHLVQAPILVTEQYPKGLGVTVPGIREALDEGQSRLATKTVFSSCGTNELKLMFEQTGRRQWVICGIETHVCVQQTTLDLLEFGYEVFLAADALGSRNPEDREVALQRMVHAGAVVSTTESLIFEVLRDAKHPQFRQAQKLVM